MTIKTKEGQEVAKAIDIIEKHLNTCPICNSDDSDFSPLPELSSEILVCRVCDHEELEEDHMSKRNISKALRSNGLLELAQEITEMEDQEFEDFLTNHIY